MPHWKDPNADVDIFRAELDHFHFVITVLRVANGGCKRKIASQLSILNVKYLSN